jgi:hypothetical protein
MDIAIQFLENKSTPTARTFIDILNGKTITGAKPTWYNELYSLMTPISIQNAISLKDDASAAAVLGVITDVFGFSSNTYKASEVNWNDNITKELQQFKDKIGNSDFQKANDEYNQQAGDWLNRMRTDPDFQKLSDEDKQSAIQEKKDKIKSGVFKQHGNFKYESPEKKKPNALHPSSSDTFDLKKLE